MRVVYAVMQAQRACLLSSSPGALRSRSLWQAGNGPPQSLPRGSIYQHCDNDDVDIVREKIDRMNSLQAEDQNITELHLVAIPSSMVPKRDEVQDENPRLESSRLMRQSEI